MDWQHERELIVSAGQFLSDRNLVAANDGNISLRLPDGTFLLTPTGVNKGELVAEKLCHTDADGNLLSGDRPSSEGGLHLAIFRARPDVKAIIHAHPLTATAFTVCGRNFCDPPLIPEVLLAVGRVKTVDYFRPGSEKLAEAAAEAAKEADVLLLSHHGAVAFGETMTEARYRLESLEHCAKLTLCALQIGDPQPLPESAIRELEGRSVYR